MFDKWLNLPAHYYLRITAFTILMVGIAVSNVLMSIGAIWVISNWLIEADFKNYKTRIKKSPIFWLFFSFLILSLFSLFWSDDLDYGFKDLMIKLPFFVIPMVMSISKPIDNKVFYFLIYVFLGIILLTSLSNYIWYNYMSEETGDIRNMSRLISHVRFSILLDLAMFSAFYLILKKKLNVFLLILIIVWLVYYIYKAQILNGYLLFLILSIYTIYYFIGKLKVGLLRKMVGMLLSIGLVASFFVLKNGLDSEEQSVQSDFSNLEQKTVNNNRYYHDTLSLEFENGYPVWVYVCQDEIKSEWNKRSDIDYMSVDKKGQPMFGTLMRYMTSLNYRKDSVDLWKLNEIDIQNIENGHTSVVMNSSGATEKFNAFKIDYNSYMNGGDPNGHSLMQRVEHLKTALLIVKNDWLFGVGIGDVNRAFEEAYQLSNSKLIPENQHRSHNQFLSVWIAMGVLGLIIFISLILFPIMNQKNPDYFLMIVTISLIVSCFFQDMLETQAGVTIFAVFYSITAFKEKEEFS